MSFLIVEIQYNNYKNSISSLSIATERGDIINNGLPAEETGKTVAFMLY